MQQITLMHSIATMGEQRRIDAATDRILRKLLKPKHGLEQLTIFYRAMNLWFGSSHRPGQDDYSRQHAARGGDLEIARMAIGSSHHCSQMALGRIGAL
jgi:hypothetical protein